MGRLYFVPWTFAQGENLNTESRAQAEICTQNLQSKPPGVTEIPQSALVAQRLAQCLDPRLPSGVHQKALEVYNYVFAILQVCKALDSVKNEPPNRS